MNSDVFQYGFAPKGTSALVFRSPEYMQCMYFSQPDWPGMLNQILINCYLLLRKLLCISKITGIASDLSKLHQSFIKKCITTVAMCRYVD